MPDQAYFYRVGLVEGIAFLALLVLAFYAITVLGRERWLRLGATESLLARLAGAAVLAAIGVGGLSGPGVNLILATFSGPNVTVGTARTQALFGLTLALALAIVSCIRIEVYHRRIVNPAAREEEGDWKVEPPEAAGRR